MKGHYLTNKEIEKFRNYLREEEKSENTMEKYIRDVTAFSAFCDGTITKDTVIAYKQNLIDSGYAVRSINSMLASINSLFSFLGWYELRVKSLKVQQQVFCPEEKEMTKAEYERLCRTAERKQNERLCLILQTICGTGIRVSELQFITVEAVRKGEATVSLKGKTRSIFIVRDLQKKLLRYISEQHIMTGAIFITRTGKPMSRTNIWREMKSLCIEAEVNPEKGISAQSSPSFRPRLLRYRKGQRQARRYSRAQQHQYDKNLYYLYRHRTPSAYGTYAADIIKKPPRRRQYIICIMLQSCQNESIVNIFFE